MVQPSLRFVEGAESIDNSLFHAALGKRYNKVSFWLGTTFSYVDLDTRPDIREIRLWQGLVWRPGLVSDNLSLRTRLEQRKALDHSQISNRFRQRAKLDLRLSTHTRLVLFDEVFFNINRVPWIITHTFDQNRAFIGIEKKLTQKMRVRLGYLNQRIFAAQTLQVNALDMMFFYNFNKPE